jgi:mRNA interferase MazF
VANKTRNRVPLKPARRRSRHGPVLQNEQQGDRFGVIDQADELLPRSVVIVAPTSRSARPASFRPEIEIGGTTARVLVEQIGAVDSSRLGRRAGHLTTEEMWSVDEALMTVLGLD